jgi:hypothetical protein
MERRWRTGNRSYGERRILPFQVYIFDRYYDRLLGFLSYLDGMSAWTRCESRCRGLRGIILCSGSPVSVSPAVGLPHDIVDRRVGSRVKVMMNEDETDFQKFKATFVDSDFPIDHIIWVLVRLSIQSAAGSGARWCTIAYVW